MVFDRIAENRLREAIAQGEFDNLPNAGQPLNLEDYFRTPEHLRMAYSVLKSANCLPAELELLNDIAGLERRVEAAGGDDERRRLREELEAKRLRLALLLEHKDR